MYKLQILFQSCRDLLLLAITLNDYCYFVAGLVFLNFLDEFIAVVNVLAVALDDLVTFLEAGALCIAAGDLRDVDSVVIAYHDADGYTGAALLTVLTVLAVLLIARG